MIISWKNKKLKRFFIKGIKQGINAKHSEDLLTMLTTLDEADNPKDMDLSGYDFHALKGDMEGLYSIKVNANYRLVFGFKGDNATDVDYTDYH